MSTSKTNTRPAKYNFDTVFGASGAPASTLSSRARSVYSADEVEVIRKEAFAAGKASATAEDSHAQTMAITAISQAMSVLINQFDERIAALRGDCAHLALSIARKLAETALEIAPQNEALALIGECMHKLHMEPRLVIRVASDIADHVKASIEPMSEQHGFAGRVIVLIEPSLHATACRVEWADGGIEQDLNTTFSAIQEQVVRWQAARSGEEHTS